MPRVHIVLASIAALLLALLFGMSAFAATDPPIVLTAQSLGESGVVAAASLAELPDGTADLQVSMDGLSPEATYLVRLRAGSPDAPSASFATLGIVVADAKGHASLYTMTTQVGATGEVVSLTLDWLLDGEHVVEVQAFEGDVVAVVTFPLDSDEVLETAVLHIPFEPAVEFPVFGTLTITLPAGRGVPGPALLNIEAAGLPTGTTYDLRLYAGTPELPSAAFGLLGAATSDGSGTLSLPFEEVVSITGIAEPLTADLLLDGAHFITLTDSAGTLVATASLPRLEPTGIPAVDAALAAVQRGDLQGLVSLTRPSELPCGPLTPEGFALVPACLEDEAPGTPVSVLPAAACEPYWARDPEPVLQTVVEHAGAPYAVVRGPASLPEDSLWPAAEYLVVFAPRAGSFIEGIALYVAEGHIVAVQAGCNPPERLVEHDGAPLPVLWGPVNEVVEQLEATQP